MRDFITFLNERMFDDYEALASKFTKLFKKYNLKKVKSFKVPNVGMSVQYEMNIDCGSTKYKLIIRREPAVSTDYNYVYSMYSLKDLNTEEEFITKRYFIPETVNNYVNFETLLKTITTTNKCDTIKNAIKAFTTHHSI